ncbi:MAG: hypothetical protein GVY04_02760 [Cyanobacteria bacterium]|nr:hypothetical protein [Cyanobacteria bacterium GSL.Bin1]
MMNKSNGHPQARGRRRNLVPALVNPVPSSNGGERMTSQSDGVTTQWKARQCR